MKFIAVDIYSSFGRTARSWVPLRVFQSNGQYEWTVPATMGDFFLTTGSVYEITVQPANVPLSYTGDTVPIKSTTRFTFSEPSTAVKTH